MTAFGDTTHDRCPSQAGKQGLCGFGPAAPGQPVGKAKVGWRLSAPSHTPATFSSQARQVR